MDSFEQFRQDLHDLLAHLHDPDFRPSELLCAVLGRELMTGAGPVQFEIIQAIKDLRPSSPTPAGTRPQRDFEVLHRRFVQKLTQEETAECMDLSVRSLRRAQRSAIHTMARLLWERGFGRGISGSDRQTESDVPVQDGGEEAERVQGWRAQVQQELAALQASSPEAVADVRETVAYAVELQGALISAQGLVLRSGVIPSGLLAAVHPAILRQALVMAIGQMVPVASTGEIVIDAVDEQANICITLTASRSGSEALRGSELVAGIVSAQGGSAGARADDETASLWLEVPSVGEVSVLVVDDNLELVHYYNRCLTGTRYRVVHAPQGQRTVAALAAADADVIVLDILLPDADGWELLRDLQGDPRTQAIPIIVCSVVREEHLASALGASYLPKPVQRRDLIAALDRALARGSAAATRSQANSAAAC
jgi:CheY-like chemotaxis protein